MSEELEQFLERNFTGNVGQINTGFFDRQVKKTNFEFIHACGIVFSNNINSSSKLLYLPFGIAMHDEVDSTIREIVSGLQTFSNADFSQGIADGKELWRRLGAPAENADEWQPAEASQDLLMKILETLAALSSWTGESMTNKMREAVAPILDSNPDWIEGMNHLFRAILSSLWSAFEIFAGDLWVACVNAEPRKLGFAAASGASDGLRLPGKSITIALLKEFDFNLSSSMGNALQNKFCFTSTEGIKTAYKAAFSKEPFTEHPTLKSKLQYLEQCRHLIQHSMGVVDDAFLKKTANLVIKNRFSAGEKIQITVPEIIEQSRLVIEASTLLLKFTDDWFLQARPDLVNRIASAKPVLSIEDRKKLLGFLGPALKEGYRLTPDGLNIFNIQTGEQTDF